MSYNFLRIPEIANHLVRKSARICLPHRIHSYNSPHASISGSFDSRQGILKYYALLCRHLYSLRRDQKKIRRRFSRYRPVIVNHLAKVKPFPQAEMLKEESDIVPPGSGRNCSGYIVVCQIVKEPFQTWSKPELLTLKAKLPVYPFFPLLQLHDLLPGKRSSKKKRKGIIRISSMDMLLKFFIRNPPAYCVFDKLPP